MTISTINQVLLSLIFIGSTLMLDRIFLKPSKSLPSVLKELNGWQGTRENFIDFKKYQYNQVFWQSTFQLTISIFMAGILIWLKDFAITVIGFFPWLIWFFCSIYPIIKFANVTIPRACSTSINNIKILLEGKS